jgi:hypothetical protein
VGVGVCLQRAAFFFFFSLFLLSAERESWRPVLPSVWPVRLPSFFLSLPTVNLSLGSYLCLSQPAHFLSSYLPISLSSIFYHYQYTSYTHTLSLSLSLHHIPSLLHPSIQKKLFLLCFRKWPRLLLTKNVPNCSPCARIAGRQPLPSGAEMSWAPFSATHAVSS